MNDTAIVIMAKQPQIGKTKTRLNPLLSLEETAAFYQALLLDTIHMVSNQLWADLAVAFTPPESRRYFESITPPGTLLLPVEGEDIGDCLAQVMENLLRIGYRKVLALHSDGPSLPAQYLEQATLYLEQTDIVLGPGDDGGYYLVGMSHPHTEIFKGISWSTEQVLSQTLERAKRLGLRTELTPRWYDVDIPPDLLRFQKELETLPSDRLPHSRRFLASFDLGARLD